MSVLANVTAVLTVMCGVFLGVLYTVPEYADFHAGLWSGTQEQRDFTLVTDGLWKIDLPWHLTPFHEENLDLFLLHSKAGWCLSDAGGYDTWVHAHASALIAAIRRTIGQEPLKYVLLTHGHVDHVGALDTLFGLYPDIKVVIHEAEADFIAGPNQYFASKSESWQHAALRLVKISPRQEFKMSKERLIVLRGDKGSLKSIGVPEFTWDFTPGHSPGHVVYTHLSGIMLGGDFADVLDRNGPALKVVCGTTCNMTTAKRSICKIAKDLQWTKIIPYHDAFKKGYSKRELLPLAISYAGCS